MIDSKQKEQDPDLGLVQECQRVLALGEGAQGSFRPLYEAYKDRVYSICYRITGNATDALDASQEAFSQVFRRLQDFRFESKFSSWVYRVAVNASIDLKRRSSSRKASSLDTLQSGPVEKERPQFEDIRHEHPGSVASRRELEKEIQSAILRLSPKLRTVIVLRYVEGLPYERIAESLDVSLGTVKSRLSRAHAAMDRELSPLIDRHFRA
ncbi:MAG: sigma-70 family RNA polymerase sigma factor [Planctomycetota bacterium]